MSDHDENAVPTLAQADQQKLEKIEQIVRKRFGVSVHVKKVDYDTGRIEFQLHSHEMEEESRWARAVHDLQDKGYSPEKVFALISEHEDKCEEIEEVEQQAAKGVEQAINQMHGQD